MGRGKDTRSGGGGGGCGWRRWVVCVGLAALVIVLWHGLCLIEPSRHSYHSRVSSDSRDELRFIVIGDFGTGIVPGREHHQMEVAAALSSAAKLHKPMFVMTTGDIIYSYGITSAHDPQLQEKFFVPYSEPALRVPWHIIPGNHDCRGSVDAMLDVAKLYTQWHMPSRYYVEEFSLQGLPVRILYLDTCLLVCGDMSNFRCEDDMAPNLSPEARAEELAWLDRELAVPAWWKIVVGHWSVFSTRANGPTPELVQDLFPLLVKHGVHAYFNGHDHSLQHLTKGGVHFFVSGGGGYETQPELKPEAHGELNHGVAVRFSEGWHGFGLVTLTPHALNTTFVGTEGRTHVYSSCIQH